MAYVLKVHTIAGSAAGDDITTSSIDTTGANLIVVGVSFYNGAGSPTIQDNKSNSFTPLTQKTISTETGGLYYVASPTVGSGHTFTAAGAGRFASIAAVAFSGALGSSPFDVENGNTGAATTSLITNDCTPTQDNELVVTIVGLDDTAPTMSITAGFTPVLDQVDSTSAHRGLGLAYSIQTTAAVAHPLWSWTTALNAIAAIGSFKAAVTMPGMPQMRQGGMGALIAQ